MCILGMTLITNGYGCMPHMCEAYELCVVCCLLTYSAPTHILFNLTRAFEQRLAFNSMQLFVCDRMVELNNLFWILCVYTLNDRYFFVSTWARHRKNFFFFSTRHPHIFRLWSCQVLVNFVCSPQNGSNYMANYFVSFALHIDFAVDFQFHQVIKHFVSLASFKKSV